MAASAPPPLQARLDAIAAIVGVKASSSDAAAAQRADDTRALAGCVMLLRTIVECRQTATADAAATATAPSSASASTGAAVSPVVGSLLASISSSLGPFLTRLLRSREPLPAALLTSTNAATTHAHVAMQVLAELCAHESACRGVTTTDGLVAAMFDALVDDAATAAAPQRRTLLRALATLAPTTTTVTTSPRSTSPAQASLTQLQRLCALLPQWSASADSDDKSATLHTLRCLAWQLPLVLSASPLADRQRALSMVPSLALLFEHDQSASKFECLAVLVTLHECVPIDGGTRDLTSPPLPPFLFSMRTGLTSLLASKLDSTNRLRTLRLSRLLLQRYGPLFATLPGPKASSMPNTATSTTASYLSLMCTVFTVELRLALDEFASTRPADMQRLETTTGVKEEIAVECLDLMHTLTQNLVGEDEDVAPPSRPHQWWNLPMADLMHFKRKLDECSEAVLLFFSELQSKSTHPRSPTLVRACARALAEWMAEDTETHKDAVNAILPFLLSLASSSSSSSFSFSSPSSSSSSGLMSLVLPALLALSEDAASKATLLREGLLPRLAEYILAEFTHGVEHQAAFLTLGPSGGDERKIESAADNDVADDEREDIHQTVTRQLEVAVQHIGDACTIVRNLCAQPQGASSSQLKQLQQEWSRGLQPALTAAAHLCDKLDLEHTRDDIQTTSRFLQKKFAPV